MNNIPQKRAPRNALRYIPAGQATFLPDTPVITEQLTWCPQCRQHLPASAFHAGGTGWCTACKTAHDRQQRATFGPRFVRERNLRGHYGITHQEYDRLFTQQSGLCAACGLPETKLDSRTHQTKYLSVDHDHTTGRIRGLLCARCNVALGCLMDDPDRIVGLLAYAIHMLNDSENG